MRPRLGPICLLFAIASNKATFAEPESGLAESPTEQIMITAQNYNNGIGTSDAASAGTILSDLVESRPALRPGEVLELVPGMIVTQHSGDGKANQYFLRGFNLDHGTDFATFVNGLPVNMPTNAHGQGYSDLNFLIPELVDHIDYRKGPYFAKNGDFGSAGSADIAYRKTVPAAFALVSVGEDHFERVVAAGSTPVLPGIELLGALELQHNDGPWTQPEGHNKANGLLTASSGDDALGWSMNLMGYNAHWDSTDQVPERLIDAGTYQGRPFGRFDAVDPTDGGESARSSLSGEWHRNGAGTATNASGYLIDYRLKLFSNFTYALDRPVEGDQFSQQEDRQVYGLSASHVLAVNLFGMPASAEIGLQVRRDHIDVGLYDTVARQITATKRDDRVDETMSGLYGQLTLPLAPRLRAIAGLRYDAARFQVDSRVDERNSGNASAQLSSPKLSLIAGPWDRTEFFLNAGRGFHSNDARGTTAHVDPATGESISPVPGLVASRGYELGARSEWIHGLQTSLALWRLDFDSELVYVGDEGATEPNRPSSRRGIEFNNRYIPVRGLLIDLDLAWTHARFSDFNTVGAHIPNSVDQVASLGITLRDRGAWGGSMQWRYVGPGALIEDNSVRSHSSLTANLRVSRQLGLRSELTLDVFNLFDRQVDDIEYFYESRLPGESSPVNDLHVHPGEPREFRVSFRARL
jgi:outer membrane receptor protein involved in Fe transport